MDFAAPAVSECPPMKWAAATQAGPSEAGPMSPAAPLSSIS